MELMILQSCRVFHKYGTLLESGWYDTQTWAALHKVWLGYVIAKDKEEYDNLIKYASIIQKLEKELGIEVSSFPQLDMMASSLDDDDDRDKEAEGKNIRGRSLYITFN
jgi:hypothetical protein